MAYGKKYSGNFTGIKGDAYILEIYEKDYVGSSSTVIIATAPIVSYPKYQIGYTWLFSSGIEFQLLSQSDRQFINLYTNDKSKYKLKLLKNNSIEWYGFLDTENYSENFNEKNNYSVNLTGNDGFKLLERFKFINSNYSKVTGIKSLWEILLFCLNKIEFNDTCNIFINNNITVNGTLESASQNVLQNVFVNTANYYDEEGEAMNCKDVIISILQSLQFIMLQEKSDIYLFNLDTLVDGDNSNIVSFKKYNLLGTYIETINKQTYIGDITSIGVATNSSNLSIQPNINSQKIVSSLYVDNTTLDYTASENDFSDMYGVVSYATTNDNYKWIENKYNDSAIINDIHTDIYFAKQQGTGLLNSGTTDYYIVNSNPKYQNYGTYVNKFKNKLELPYSNFVSGKYGIKLNVNAFFRFKDLLGSPTESTYSDAKYGEIDCIIRIGGKQWSSHYNRWVASGATSSTNIVKLLYAGDYQRNTTIGDKWLYNITIQNEEMSEGLFIPLPASDGIEGNIEIIFLDIMYCATQIGTVYTPMNYIKDIRIKDIKIEVMNIDNTTATNDDLIYSAKVDENSTIEGKQIKNILSTNTYDIPTAKAAMLNNSTPRSFIKLFDKYGTSDELENHNLNFIIENYENQTYQLDIKINMINSIVGYLRYNNHLPNIQLIPTSVKFDYADNVVELSLNQIKKYT